MPEITWSERNDELTYFGRNGVGICHGIVAYTHVKDDIVYLAPINSKGNIARCRIEVPKSALIQLAELVREEKE